MSKELPEHVVNAITDAEVSVFDRIKEMKPGKAVKVKIHFEVVDPATYAASLSLRQGYHTYNFAGVKFSSDSLSDVSQKLATYISICLSKKHVIALFER